MSIKRFIPGFLLAVALASCIQDEALNKEAAIDACTGTDVQFTSAYSDNGGFYVYVNRGADLSSQTLTFTVPDGATIATADTGAGDTAFTRNDDGTYTATLDFDNDSHARLLTVTSEDGANRATYVIEIVQMELPTYYHFEDLQTSDPYHVLMDMETAITSDGMQRVLLWSSGNPGFELTREASTPEDYPTVRVAGGWAGYCAKLETRDTGAFGAMVGMYIAAGNLFIGSFDLTNALNDALGSTKFGVQFYEEPVSLRGYYKYKRGEVYTESGKEVDGKQDSFHIYAMLYEADDSSFMLNGANGLTDSSIVLLAQLDEADALEADEWTEFEISFEPANNKTVDAQRLSEGKYKLGIVFTSSRDGGNFNGAVGSTLWVDEVELTCK